mgnify:FL=1
MKWCDDLYIGHEAMDDKDNIVSKIKEGNVLAAPFNDTDVLDIYPSYVLLQKRYLNSELMIYGIAKGKEEAYDMTQLIIMDCFRATGQFKLKEYMKNNHSFT